MIEPMISYDIQIHPEGAALTMHYQRVGTTSTGRGMWDFRPAYCQTWSPVKNPRIVANLDAGKHPRDGIQPGEYSKGEQK